MRYKCYEQLPYLNCDFDSNVDSRFSRQRAQQNSNKIDRLVVGVVIVIAKLMHAAAAASAVVCLVIMMFAYRVN